MKTQQRIESLILLLRKAGIDALIVTNLVNIRYLTGFTGSAGLLVIAPQNGSRPQGLLCTDGRYSEQAARQLELACADADLFVGNPSSQMEAAASFVPKSASIYIEAESTSLATFESWKRKLNSAPIPSPVKIESLRRFKDEEEIGLIRRASHLADTALSELVRRLLDHPSEIEFAAELEYKMRMLGADGPSFETIVASGPNSAMPHARPTGRKIHSGDVVVIDYGATVDGYHSDCTRTYFVGASPTEDHSRVYEAVSRSQSRGVEAVRQGAKVHDIDIICRESLEEEGLGEYFSHGTGHGVGLEIHELPWVSKGNESELSLGEVLTVEPGAYLEETFGVRIEDTIALTSGGPETLTLVAKSPWVG